MPAPHPTIYDRTGEPVFCDFCRDKNPAVGETLAVEYCPDCGHPVCFWCKRIFQHQCGEVAESG